MHKLFIVGHGLSLVAASGGCSQVVHGLLTVVTSRCRAWVLGVASVTAGVGSGAQAQQLWDTGMPHGMWDPTFWMRAQTHVPCITRWILNHLTAKGVPRSFCLMDVFHSFLFIDTCLVLTSVIEISVRDCSYDFLAFCCHSIHLLLSSILL